MVDFQAFRLLWNILPRLINSIFNMLKTSLHKPTNPDISDFSALFSGFLFCPESMWFPTNLHRFTGKWCSKGCRINVIFLRIITYLHLYCVNIFISPLTNLSARASSCSDEISFKSFMLSKAPFLIILHISPCNSLYNSYGLS